MALSEKPYLSGFYLGNQLNKEGKSRPRKNQKTEILFIERVWDFLKPGTGRAAVVLPDGRLAFAVKADLLEGSQGDSQPIPRQP